MRDTEPQHYVNAPGGHLQPHSNSSHYVIPILALAKTAMQDCAPNLQVLKLLFCLIALRDDHRSNDCLALWRDTHCLLCNWLPLSVRDEHIAIIPLTTGLLLKHGMLDSEALKHVVHAMIDKWTVRNTLYFQSRDEPHAATCWRVRHACCKLRSKPSLNSTPKILTFRTSFRRRAAAHLPSLLWIE